MGKLMAKDMGVLGAERIPTRFAEEAPSQTEVTARKKARLRRISVSKLRPHPLQPADRHAAGNVTDLMESIAALGLRQPPLVWLQPDGTHVILAGHRRVRACQLLAIDSVIEEKIEVYVLTDLTEREALYLIGAETFQREEFSAVHSALVVGEVWKNKSEELGRDPSSRELAGVIPPQKTSINDSLTIYRALQDPRLAPLVRAADGAGKDMLVKALRAPGFSAQVEALQAFEKGGAEAMRKALSKIKGGRPPKPVTRQKRRDGYVLTVRVRPTMSAEDAENALVALQKAEEDLQRLINAGRAGTPEAA